MLKHYRFLLPLFSLLFAGDALSQDSSAIGVWQTEPSDKGYLHVSIEECDDALCGTILQAYDLEGAPLEGYEHLGENMLWDMKSTGESSWSGGKIWDPSKDKTYKSKMDVADDVLNVSGCIMVFCRAQTWERVQ